MVQQWNASQNNANNTLSGSPALTTTKTAGNNSNASTFAANPVTSGKYYWEWTLGGGYLTNADTSCIGIGDTTSGVSAFLGVDTHSLGWFTSDGFFYNGTRVLLTSTTMTLAQLSAASGLMCCALDYTNALFYMRIGTTGNWNGDATGNPATQTFGVSMTGLIAANGNLVPAVEMFNTSDSVVAAFAQASWAGSAPSGFGPFDPVSSGRPRVIQLLGGMIGWRASLLAASTWRAGNVIEKNDIITRRSLILPSRRSLIGHNGGPQLEN